MSNNIVYIKMLQDCGQIKHFEGSYKDERSGYYNFTKANNPQHTIEQLNLDEELFLIGLVHDTKEVHKAYLGTGELISNEKGRSIKYSIKVVLDNCTAVENIFKLSELNLDSDFGKGEYILVENSVPISEQLDFIINPPSEKAVGKKEYDELDTEESLHPLAQKNQYCNRQYNLREPMENRGEFQRDYERIIHSKAFRRMVDKVQIFSSAKGDYYRTRMTHSQTVAQIARGIAEGLNVNIYLTEAIALAHDIGHTPFGHQGERTLDNILRGKIKIIKDVDLYSDDWFGGFKHNFQSVRVASALEEEYSEIYGMDLTYQTLEGMLKHTKLKKEQFGNGKEYQLKEFISTEGAEEMLHFDQECCSTLEGQIVAIADEIAQRGHDLDDALSSGAMTFGEFKEFLTVKKIQKLEGIVSKVDEQISSSKEQKRRLIDENELKHIRVVSSIISYFINDVIDNGYLSSTSQEDDRQLFSFSEFAEDYHWSGGYVNQSGTYRVNILFENLEDYNSFGEAVEEWNGITDKITVTSHYGSAPTTGFTVTVSRKSFTTLNYGGSSVLGKFVPNSTTSESFSEDYINSLLDEEWYCGVIFLNIDANSFYSKSEEVKKSVVIHEVGHALKLCHTGLYLEGVNATNQIPKNFQSIMCKETSGLSNGITAFDKRNLIRKWRTM